MTPDAHQLNCLRWAVENAAAMRGMLTGGPAELLDEFDRNIAAARAALNPAPAEVMGPEDEFTLKLPSAACGEVGEPLPRTLSTLLWLLVDFCYAPIYWGENTGPTGTTELTFTRHPTRAGAAAGLQFFITHDGS